MHLFIYIPRNKIYETQVAYMQNIQGSQYVSHFLVFLKDNNLNSDLTSSQVYNIFGADTVTYLNSCKEPARRGIITRLCILYVEACYSKFTIILKFIKVLKYLLIIQMSNLCI